MKLRHWVMLAALAIAAWLVLFGDKTPEADLAEPVVRPASSPAPSALGVTAGLHRTGEPAAQHGHAERAAHTAPIVLALRVRAPQIEGADSAGELNADDAKGLFSSQAWVPPAVAAAAAAKKAAAEAPPPPPEAPPLPFKYVGQQTGGGQFEIYLSRGEEVFVVREHSVIEGTYRVDSINPKQLTLTYLPLKQIQNLSTGVTD
ncbi:MAG: hypothetical protein ACHP7O_08100 [Burkholderiales bacterium]